MVSVKGKVLRSAKKFAIVPSAYRIGLTKRGPVSTKTRRADSFHVVQRTEIRGSRPLGGKQEITLLVGDRR
jgi:hypothetical protein